MDRTRALLDRLISWSPALLLGGLAALTYWLDAQVQAPAARRDGSTRHDPDLFLVNFRATNFDENGNPKEALAAKRGDHFPDDESAELLAPMFKITQAGKPAFTVTADRGKITGDRENAYFTGHVEAHREAESASSAGPGKTPAGPVTLTTDYLHVNPKTERADTDRPVTIKEPRGIIESIGLTLDNKSKTLKLKSRVTGTLEPNSLPKK
jgi:lipopolysaccharide export system protein LptC